MDAPPRLPAWTLIQAAHLVGRGFHELFAQVGLTPTQFGVLAQLADDPGLSQAELARRSLIRPQSMGELTTALRARDLVARTGGGGRGRPSGLTLTDAGRDVLAAAWPLVHAFNAAERLGLSAEQAVTLDDLLGRVVEAFGARPDRPG